MLSKLCKLRLLFDTRDTSRLGLLLLVVVGIAVLEVVGLASILPFLQLASDPESITSNAWLLWFYEGFGFTSRQSLLVSCGVTLICVLALSNGLAALSVWQRQRLAWAIAHDISMKLVDAYKKLPYEFFLRRNSASLIRKAIDDVNSLVIGVLLSGCQLVSQLVVSVAIFSLLIFVKPVVATLALGLFGGIYAVVYFARRTYLADLGEARLSANLDRYRGFVEFVSGIKSIRSGGAIDFFAKRFEEPSAAFALVNPRVQFAAQLPRYVVETMAFGAVIVLILIFVGQEQSLVTVLPTLTLFAVAGYRLMPAINNAYAATVQILSNYPAVQAILDDTLAAKLYVPASKGGLPFEHSIVVQDLSFTYSGSSQSVLQHVSLEIEKGTKVAIVGPSGSGKTTLVDIVIGLLHSTSGSLLVDGNEISRENVGCWQALVGYVPQEVFLFDDTVEANVTFGATLDRNRVEEACRIAQIDQFIQKELEEGYQAKIGERGVRLSGGQRQRLGLARAIYRSPEVLVLDEATSALDTQTEAAVVASLHSKLPGLTVIMIAHRISTVRRCDRLYMVDRGQLVDSGSYDELLASNETFREMSRFN